MLLPLLPTSLVAEEERDRFVAIIARDPKYTSRISAVNAVRTDDIAVLLEHMHRLLQVAFIPRQNAYGMAKESFMVVSDTFECRPRSGLFQFMPIPKPYLRYARTRSMRR